MAIAIRVLAEGDHLRRSKLEDAEEEEEAVVRHSFDHSPTDRASSCRKRPQSWQRLSRRATLPHRLASVLLGHS